MVDRADEAAEARAVGTEDDRHVARVVDGADGVGVVVDVGRVKARFPAVAARPLGLGSDEADARAIGVVVDLPRRGEERLDVVLGEEVGRAVGSVEDADLPDLGVRGQGVVRGAGSAASPLGAARRAEHVARRSARPPCPPKRPEHEGRLRAQVRRHVEPAAHREVRAAPGAGDRAELELAPGRDAHGLQVGRPARRRRSAFIARAGERDDRVRPEAQRRPGQRHLEAGRAVVVAHEAIGQPKARGRPSVPTAERPPTRTRGAREILHGGLRPAVDHLDGRRSEVHVGEEARSRRRRRERPASR